MLRVERADPVRIADARASWNRLVDALPRPSIFCTWEWVYTWWRHFGDAYELVVLFFYRGEDLVGILPLASRFAFPGGSLIPGRTLSYCGSAELSSDHVDVICAASDASECLDAAVAFLREEYHDWDVVHLSHVAEDASIAHWASGGMTPFPIDVRHVSRASYIDLSGGYATFERDIGGRKRRNLDRVSRKLRETHAISYTAYDPPRFPNAIRELFELHQRRAAAKRMKTSFTGEALIRFHEEIAGLLHPQGRLRLRFLRQGDRAVAANYCFELNGRVFGYQQGFDPEWESQSVANVLVLEIIKEACADGIRELDMLRGGIPYKRFWTDRSRALLSVSLYNRTVRGRLIRWACRGRSAVATRVRRLLRPFARGA